MGNSARALDSDHFPVRGSLELPERGLSTRRAAFSSKGWQPETDTQKINSQKTVFSWGVGDPSPSEHRQAPSLYHVELTIGEEAAAIRFTTDCSRQMGVNRRPAELRVPEDNCRDLPLGAERRKCRSEARKIRRRWELTRSRVKPAYRPRSLLINGSATDDRTAWASELRAHLLRKHPDSSIGIEEQEGLYQQLLCRSSV